MVEEIVIENYVDDRCIRHVHLMSNVPMDVKTSVWGEGAVTKEAGAWHFRSERPYRGPLDIQAAAGVNFRRLVVWSLEGCGSVREAIGQAEAEFKRLFGFLPRFVFIKKLPSAVKDWQDVGGMVMLETEWMMERCVAVGGMR